MVGRQAVPGRAGADGEAVRVGRHTVQLTHPGKVLFPADGITKADLLEYYVAVARRMIPHLKDRPVNLQRFPSGIDHKGFFQQEMPDYFPDWIDGVTVQKEGGQLRHVMIQDAGTLAYLASQACITPHAWLSRAGQLEYPDQMVLDLDPTEAEGDQLRGAAAAAGALLVELGLTPFLKTTGSRGYHVVVPLDGRLDFDMVRAFAHDVAEVLARRHPAELTSETRKAKRGGRIYIDTLRNAYAHTAVPAYAVRARAGAPVATPIDWEELADPAMHAARFTIRNVLDRRQDPWAGFRRSARGLTRAREKLDEMRQASSALY